MTGRLGVLGDARFRRFWIGESVSLVGSEVTLLALPLTAVVILHAAPEQMGLLTAVHLLPFLLAGLPAGVLVDRMSRRRVLVAGDLIDAIAVGVVPIAAIAGFLGMPVLYVLNFIIGLVDVFGAVAWQAFIPSIVGRDRLVEANARLEVSSSVASIVGPGLGGVLVQLLTAPVALVVDALSYLFSAAMVWTVRAEEPIKPRGPDAPSVRAQLVDGLRAVVGRAPLRNLMLGGSIHNFFSRMIDALFVLYAVSSLDLSPAGIGLVFAAAGPGALLGAVAVGTVNRFLGVGPALIVLQVVTGISRLLIPVAGIASVAALGGGSGTPVVLAASSFLLGLARTAFNVTQVSLRVAITPDELLGRMNASIRFLMWSVTPFGAVAGGLLAASAFGITATMWLAGAGVLVAFVPFLAPSLRTIRTIDEMAAGGEGSGAS
ncbi:MAG TPA: MFS transporter [Candidatus Limnocylindrales bacterium]